MAITNFESAPSLFVGQGDIILFDAVPDYSTATLASLTNPKSLGQVVDGSSNWTGDDVSVEEIRDEQGDLITATVSAGTLSYEIELASTSKDVIETFLNGVGITGATLASVFSSVTSAVGFGVDLPVMTRPIGWLNDEQKRLLLFPKGKITANLAFSDKLFRVHLAALAEYIDRPDLKTGMVFDSAAAAQYGS